MGGIGRWVSPDELWVSTVHETADFLARGGRYVRHSNVRDWWLAAVRYLRPERVVRVPADEVLNFSQTVWEWLCISPACVVDEAETSKPECPDLGPLFSVIPLGNFEGAPHPPKTAPAFWALSRSTFRPLP